MSKTCAKKFSVRLLKNKMHAARLKNWSAAFEMLLLLLKTKKRFKVKLRVELTIRADMFAIVMVETATLCDKSVITKVYTK